MGPIYVRALQNVVIVFIFDHLLTAFLALDASAAAAADERVYYDWGAPSTVKVILQ